MASNASAASQTLKYRGTLRGIAARGEWLFLCTTHPEGQPTALIALDVDRGTYRSTPLKGGGTFVSVFGEQLVFGVDDGSVSRGKTGNKRFTPLARGLEPAAAAAAALSDGRWAVLSGARVLVLDRAGEQLQELTLEDLGTALASSPDGRWLVAGTDRGTVAVYECESGERFTLSEAAPLHSGRVTALAFDPEELRFYSAGADNRLLLTHARGRLEPEDRGGNGGHSKPITALLVPGGPRLYTGSKDRTLKAWQRGSSRRPTTTKDGVGATVALAVVQLGGRPHLAQGCADSSVRLFPMDAEGKLGERARIYRGAMDWAEVQLSSAEVSVRKAALEQLAEWNDGPSIDLLAERAGSEGDHELKVLATTLLGSSGSPRASRHLEGLLRARQGAVRVAALEGLRALEGAAELSPLRLALETGQADVGEAAVAALRQLAGGDDQAAALLIQAMDRDPYPVRSAALLAVEALHPEGSPAGDLRGLRSSRSDIRSLALTRLYQRKLLDLPAVQAALRQHAEDPDPSVRQAASLIAVAARPKLARILRSLDPELHRQLHELEQLGRRGKPKAPPKLKPRAVKGLKDEDLAPLLQAMASRALDTCLRGARGLALLGDPRAFGTLLQLSRERDAGARRETCLALQILGDRRAVERLRTMLRDGDMAVRDAAFTALAELCAETPLAAAEAGLGAQHEDVRKRGLQLLIEHLRAAEDGRGDEAISLLTRAMDDGAESVRREAFKAALSLRIGGDEPGTLRAVRGSLHSDIRREVLTEVTAQLDEPWAWELLLELLDDPDADLRGEAFEIAVKKGRRAKRPELLRRALRCAYADLRIRAAEVLNREPEGEAIGLLVQALDDEDRRVRGTAITALVALAAADPLVAAMGSDRSDVRLEAAVARAIEGDERALEPLVATAGAPEPENSAEQALWKERVLRALEGLAELGHPGGLAAAADRLRAADASIRAAAIRAVMWSSRPGDTAALSEALRHRDETVRSTAAAGLAICGDPAGSSLIFGAPDSGRSRLAFAAAAALGPLGEDQLVSYLDSSSELLRRRSFLLLMMREARGGEGSPERCIAALSSERARTRLAAARALEVFHDPAAFEDYLVALFLHRGHDPSSTDEAPWELDRQIVRDIADAVTWGAPQLRARAAGLLDTLSEDRPARFEQRWAIFARREAEALEALRGAARRRGAAGPRAGAEELRELIFGAYVGLSRQGGQSSDGRVRLSAVRRLTAMATEDATLTGGVTPVLIQALRDSSQPVRALAFEGLRALGTDPSMLGSEALSVGHIDVGVLGLKLLAEQGGSDAGRAVLERVMLSHEDGLELEAAALLAEQIGWVPTCARALEAASERMRTSAVRDLGGRLEGGADGAREALLTALDSRFRQVRFTAAGQLASSGDSAAIPVLVEQLRSDRAGEQSRAIDYLMRLRDGRIPGLLLDRIDEDPAGTARRDLLLRAAGLRRDPSIADRLLAYLEDRELRQEAFGALLTISGYDQPIEDPEDDGEWLERQHPRDERLLLRLARALHRLGADGLLGQLLPGLTWAPSGETDALLATLCAAPNDSNRRRAVSGMGWRVRRRGAEAAPLIRALEHPDPSTRFLAALALARAGRAEGLSILMSSVELLEDFQQRQDAVLALGELADPRALDLLLRLASEEEHALQEVAAEAIGHMADSDRDGRIVPLLSSYSERDDELGLRALRGLRHYGSPGAWRILRKRLGSAHWELRQLAAEQLGYDNDPGTRVLLAEHLRSEEDIDVAKAAAKGLRRLYGPDSLEPDFLFVQATCAPLEEHTLDRIAERGDAERILAVLPRIQPHNREDYREPLVRILLSRDPLPVDAAAAGLSSADAGTVAVAARVLGRAGAATHAAALGAAIERVGALWREALATLTGAASDADAARARGRIGPLSEALGELAWACGRTGAGGEELVRLADSSGPAERVRALRRRALIALCSGAAGAAGLDALERAAGSGDPDLRALAAGGLAALSPERAAAATRAHLGDGALLGRLLAAGTGTEALRGGAADVHHQGAVLPQLVARGDIEGLAAVLADGALPELSRLGALDALAQIATEASVAPIAAIAGEQTEDEALRKAAWRALRRARRAMARRQEVSA